MSVASIGQRKLSACLGLIECQDSAVDEFPESDVPWATDVGRALWDPLEVGLPTTTQVLCRLSVG
jgi:hypothetical protein